MDPKQSSHEEAALKRVAFFSVALSTVAILGAIIAVPMIYNYMQVLLQYCNMFVD